MSLDKEFWDTMREMLSNKYSFTQNINPELCDPLNKKGQTFKELAHQYQEKYRLEVLPKLSKGRQKMYGFYGEERGWYDPDEDNELQCIDALYDLFDRLKKGGADNAGTNK